MQFQDENQQPLTERFSPDNKYLRPALPKHLSRADLDAYRVRAQGLNGLHIVLHTWVCQQESPPLSYLMC